MIDFETWLHDYGDRVYRYWVYKRMFTPCEQEAKYSDQCCYEDEICQYGIIKEAVELPDGDILLGFVDPDDEGTRVEGYITYQKLSEISLAFCPLDMEDGDD